MSTLVNNDFTLLNNQNEWEGWIKDRLMSRDIKTAPKSFPCYGYFVVSNWTLETVETAYFYPSEFNKDELAKQIAILIKSAYVTGILDNGIAQKNHLEEEIEFATKWLEDYLNYKYGIVIGTN